MYPRRKLETVATSTSITLPINPMILTTEGFYCMGLRPRPREPIPRRSL